MVGWPGIARSAVCPLSKAPERAQTGNVKSHRPRTYLLYGVGVIAAGVVAWWVLMALLHLLVTMVIVFLVVGGAVMAVRASRRSKGSIRGSGRSIRR